MLLAVLIIVGSALLVATSVAFMAHAEYAGHTVADRALQDRALAWSGVQVVTRRLDAQRDRILQGELPELDDQYEIFRVGGGRIEGDGGRLGIVRLLPIGPGGERLIPESAKLDINELPEENPVEQLTATGLITPDIAEAIIARRDRAPDQRLDSIVALLDSDVIGPRDLIGPLEDMTASPGGTLDDVMVPRPQETSEPRGLADLLTVFAVEPALQRDGRLRINLNVDWSEELGRRLNDRFGEGAAEIVGQVIDQGTTFDRDAVIVQVLRFFDAPIEDWPDILDALTTHSETFLFGRLNINAASAAGLQGLPGITPEQAAEMVRARESLEGDQRWTPLWPVAQEIITPEQFQEIIDHITTRSWTYRVRLAAGEVDADDPRGPMAAPVVWELVIDLADPVTRVAYLRDVSLEPIACQVALALGEEAFEADDAMPPMMEEEEAISTDDAESRARAWPADEEQSDAGGNVHDESVQDESPADVNGEADASDDDAGSSSDSAAPASKRRLGRWSDLATVP